MPKKNKGLKGEVSPLDLHLVPIIDRLSSRTERKRLSTHKSSQPREKLASTTAVESSVLRKTRKNGHSTKKKILLPPRKPLNNPSKTKPSTTPDDHCPTEHSHEPITLPLACTTNDHEPLIQTDGDDVIMCGKTRQEKEKLQLARQKQLEEMRAREAAEAREERLLKRSGLWTAPVKKQTSKNITWNDIALVCNY